MGELHDPAQLLRSQLQWLNMPTPAATRSGVTVMVAAAVAFLLVPT